MTQEKKVKQNNKSKRLKLVWRFMHGSKAFFMIGIISALIAAVIDVINPQIISVTVDSIIGNEEASLPEFIMNLINRAGGFAYFRDKLYIVGLLIIVLAAIGAGILLVFLLGLILLRCYCSRRFTARARERIPSIA